MKYYIRAIRGSYEVVDATTDVVLAVFKDVKLMQNYLEMKKLEQARIDNGIYDPSKRIRKDFSKLFNKYPVEISVKDRTLNARLQDFVHPSDETDSVLTKTGENQLLNGEVQSYEGKEVENKAVSETTDDVTVTKTDDLSGTLTATEDLTSADGKKLSRKERRLAKKLRKKGLLTDSEGNELDEDETLTVTKTQDYDDDNYEDDDDNYDDETVESKPSIDDGYDADEKTTESKTKKSKQELKKEQKELKLKNKKLKKDKRKSKGKIVDTDDEEKELKATAAKDSDLEIDDEYYDAKDEYVEDEYEQDEYVEDEYVEDEYAQDEYVEDEYAQDEYAQDEYSEDEYAQDEFAQDEYAEDDYAQDEYADDYQPAEGDYDSYNDGYEDESY